MGTSIRKKLTAGVIATLTVLNCMLIPVAAAEGDVTVSNATQLQSAINNARQATTIVLGDDVSLGTGAISIGGGKDIKLDLDGHNLERSSASRNSLINVYVDRGDSKAKLTLVDSKGTGSVSGATYDSAIYVGRNGEFVMESGSISGNKLGNNASGGAVTVYSSGSFTMNGGTISDNTAYDGGGVYVASSGHFTMNGGTITGNTAGNNGGGVAIEDSGNFDLVNGVISANTTNNLGGGIYLDDRNAVCTIYGGSIIDNVAKNNSSMQTNTSDRGAGIYFGHYATLNFGKEDSGIKMSKIFISGNYDSFTDDSIREDNLYISLTMTGQQQRHFIHIYQGFTEDSSVGLCVSFANNNPDVKATIGYLKYNENLDPNQIFFLDQEERALILEADGEIHCVKHTHKFAYEVDGNVLHVKCTADIQTGKPCTLKADLTLNAQDADFTGEPVKATLDGILQFRRVTGFQANADDIKYYNADDEENALPSAPSDVGSYIAKYTATIGTEEYTIVKAFDIGCVNHSMKLVDFTWTEKTEGGYDAVANYKCDSCDEEQKVPATVTSETEDATCEADGKITYTATVDKDNSPSGQPEQDTKIVTIDHKGHSYSYNDFTWTPKENGEGYDVVVNYTCDNCGDKKSVVATVKAEQTDATCEAAGQIVYTATVSDTDSLDGAAKTETKTDEIEALGHDWTCTGFTWEDAADGEGYDVKVSYTCSRCKAEESVKATVTHVTEAATCEEAGKTVYTATVSAEDSLDKAAKEDTKTDVIKATGHDWEYVDITWEEDTDNGGYKAVANYVCKNDASHKDTVAATVTSEKTDPTCEGAGQIVYTAVVDATASLDNGEHKAEKIVEIDPDGHVWEFVDFTWTEDKEEGFKVTANYVCKTDDTHKKSVDATVAADKTDAACETDGQIVYTATVAAEDSLDKAAHEETKTVVITATGHDWEKPTYTWSDNNSTVTAKRVCKNDKTHVEEETVKTTSKITKNPSVAATGVRTFTSAEFKNPAFKVQTKKVDVAKLTPTPTVPADDPSVKLKISKANLTLVCGDSDTIKASLVGAKAAITWKSSNPKIATVDANGKITAKMAGAVTITASAVGKKATCNVQVLFKDVTNSKDFWYTPTYYMTDKNVVKGYDNQTLFKPANICTRAQMVTFIWRLVGQPAPKATSCKFSDVKKSDYFYQACIWGNENHIVEGYANGTFGPKINCARRHAVTFLWRLAGKPEPKSTKNKFSDLKTSDYYYKATLWASEMKILEGYNDGTFRPNGDCLRRQMVTFLYKYDKFIKKG